MCMHATRIKSMRESTGCELNHRLSVGVYPVGYDDVGGSSGR